MGVLLLIAALASWPVAATSAAGVRRADEALGRIMEVLNRPARSPSQRGQSITTALAMLDQFQLSYPEPENRAVAAFVRAQCHVGLEDYPRALAEINTALSLPLGRPYVPIARFLRGRVLVLMNRYDEGVAAIRAVLTESPGHEVAPEARLSLAQALADLGMARAALGLLDTVIRAGEPIWAVQAAQTMAPSLRMIGQRAPDFDVEALDGGRLNLSQFRGKVVLLDFWATWCGPCQITMPDLLRLYHRSHGRGFDIVGISLDQSTTALRGYLNRQGIPWPQVFDGHGWDSSLARLYDVTSIPKTFLLDKDGRIAATDLHGERLGAAVERLLAQP